jgi:type IV fimbrial biogenesis protein FimT
MKSGKRRSIRSRRSIAGVTLVELLTVIGIVTILLALAAPQYRTITTSNRMASEINGLLGDMQYARSEAITRGQIVTACASADGASCSPGNRWEAGWIVFADPNGNGVAEAGEPVLRVQKAFSGGDGLRADNNIGAVPFSREGFALGLPGTVTVTLHEPTARPFYTRCLAFSVVGMLTVQRAGTGACT